MKLSPLEHISPHHQTRSLRGCFSNSPASHKELWPYFLSFIQLKQKPVTGSEESRAHELLFLFQKLFKATDNNSHITFTCVTKKTTQEEAASSVYFSSTCQPLLQSLPSKTFSGPQQSSCILCNDPLLLLHSPLSGNGKNPVH